MTTIGPGEHQLGIGTGRDGLLFVPSGYRPTAPAPLALMLHGAGGTAAAMRFAYDTAEQLGIVILSVDSRDPRTWDVILGDYGPDVEFIGRALDQTFDRCAVDPQRIAIGGFSDGASYALSVGLGSGDIFSDITAFSPGFSAEATRRGRPAVFISHGIADTVLPIQRTSRRIVPALRSAGYDVTYREFQGGHEVPQAMVREAFEVLIRP
jgi:phospholipase/carboxylesterase